MNGYLNLSLNGTHSTIFLVPADGNQPAWYNNGTGGFGIGTSAPVCKLDVITGSLGTTAGDTITIQRLGNDNGNANYIRVNQVRETGGSDWRTTATRIQQMTDVTNQAYLQFNGTSNTYGASIGTPAISNAFVVNNSGNIGIGTWTPNYTLDVIGTSRTTLGIVAGSSDIARLILGPTPGTGNYDYCSLIQSESYTAGNYGSILSFWTHPTAGNYGDPVKRIEIDQYGNTTILTGGLYMNGNDINSVRTEYFNTGGNINSFQSGGINYLDINPPPTTGSGTGRVRIFGNAGALTFDNDVTLAATNTLVLQATTTVSRATTFTRSLSGADVAQPVLQYGTTTGSGASGSVTVTLPTGYTTAASYVAFAVMQDSTEAKIAVNRTSYTSITIIWSQGGSGSQTIAWNTMGT